jgi:integrase/recombinase XerD
MATRRKGAAPRFLQPVGDPRDATGLYAAMRRYLEHRAVLGSTEQSVYGMEASIRVFIGWADERSVTHPEHVSRAVLERYQRWLYHYRKKDGEPLSIASQRSRLIPVRGLFRWLTRSGAIPANPAADLDLPKRIRRLPRAVLTAREMETVLSLADTTTPLGLRDRALMEVLYSTGLRRAEAANLELGDIDPQRCVLLVREGKGRKDRLLPLGERALHWVQEYLAKSRPQLAWDLRERGLFLANDGTPIGMSWVSGIVLRYTKRADTGKTGGAHLIRHTMATLMLEGGADIRFIQAMLGHVELSTTQIYTQVAIRQLQQVHANTHPAAMRRVRGKPEPAPHPGLGPTPENAATALLEALAAEAEGDDERDAWAGDGGELR